MEGVEVLNCVQRSFYSQCVDGSTREVVFTGSNLKEFIWKVGGMSMAKHLKHNSHYYSIGFKVIMEKEKYKPWTQVQVS